MCFNRISSSLNWHSNVVVEIASQQIGQHTRFLSSRVLSDGIGRSEASPAAFLSTADNYGIEESETDDCAVFTM